MKNVKIYCMITLMVIGIRSFGQNTLIPDTVFEQRLITLGYDSVLDGSVLTANINTVADLDVSGLAVTDMTGLQDFVALENLNLFKNNLTSLNISANINLNWVDCGRGLITSLDVTNNTALTQLWCDSNQLTSLDLSQNSLLSTLMCFSNKIASLDLSDKDSLWFVRCDYNKLTSLNTYGAGSLKDLYCNNNLLTQLDVSGNVELGLLETGNNLLTQLDVSGNVELGMLRTSNNSLTELDVSGNVELGMLHADNNSLSCLNIRNGNNFFFSLRVSGNPALTCIEVDDLAQAQNQWTFADGDIDSLVTFSLDCANSCAPTGVNELKSVEKKLIQITDLLGRRVDIQSNQILIFRYNDGSVEKRMLFE